MDDRGDTSFLGRGWSFPPRFAVTTGVVRMSEREEDIRQSLRILFSTIPGERTMHPDYGCALHKMVFETLTETVRAKIQEEVRRAVLFFEPRVDLTGVDVEHVSEVDGKVLIHIDYIIRSINARSNMVYPFYFIEGSDVAGLQQTPAADRKG